MIATHTITYFIMGLLSIIFLDYRENFGSDYLSFMKPTDSPVLELGPRLQIFRGLIFALVLYPFRSIFLSRPSGWFHLWMLFLGLSILSTFGPTMESLEGMIYTDIPIKQQLSLLPEIIIQSFLLSLVLV